MIYVGIDPGQRGGVSFVSDKGEEFVIPMPDIRELYDLLKQWDTDFKIKHIYLEKSQAMPRQGVVSMFTYGQHFGMLQGVIIALSLPYTLVSPKEWQKEMLKGTKEPKIPTLKGTKQRALEIAKRLFPKQKFHSTLKSRREHDGMIDSILLAECCRRKIL